jgi:hypothetical protein
MENKIDLHETENGRYNGETYEVKMSNDRIEDIEAVVHESPNLRRVILAEGEIKILLSGRNLHYFSVNYTDKGPMTTKHITKEISEEYDTYESLEKAEMAVCQRITDLEVERNERKRIANLEAAIQKRNSLHAVQPTITRSPTEQSVYNLIKDAETFIAENRDREYA